MNIQLGDEVRLRSVQNKQPFDLLPGENTWLRVCKKTDLGWYAINSSRSPSIMVVIVPSYLFNESDVIEHRCGPWWIKLLYRSMP